jgi:hypothetical protein
MADSGVIGAAACFSDLATQFSPWCGRPYSERRSIIRVICCTFEQIRSARAAKSEFLKKLDPANVNVELNPREIGKLTIPSGDWVADFVATWQSAGESRGRPLGSAATCLRADALWRDKLIDGRGIRSAVVPPAKQGACHANRTPEHGRRVLTRRGNYLVRKVVFGIGSIRLPTDSTCLPKFSKPLPTSSTP